MRRRAQRENSAAHIASTSRGLTAVTANHRPAPPGGHLEQQALRLASTCGPRPAASAATPPAAPATGPFPATGPIPAAPAPHAVPAVPAGDALPPAPGGADRNPSVAGQAYHTMPALAARRRVSPTRACGLGSEEYSDLNRSGHRTWRRRRAPASVASHGAGTRASGRASGGPAFGGQTAQRGAPGTARARHRRAGLRRPAGREPVVPAGRPLLRPRVNVLPLAGHPPLALQAQQDRVRRPGQQPVSSDNSSPYSSRPGSRSSACNTSRT